MMVQIGKSAYFGYHRIVEEGDKISIYRFGVLIVSLDDWDDAVDLVDLLNKAYQEGQANGIDGMNLDWS
jgi:hypothetical protein